MHDPTSHAPFSTRDSFSRIGSNEQFISKNLFQTSVFIIIIIIKFYVIY